MKTKTSTSSNKFAEEVKACNYELKTKQEATSYSNSEDESKRSSTIDLTFAKQSLSQSVEYCEGLRVPGFLNDHRVIETLVKRTVKTTFKTMPCWHKMTPEKFQRHLKPRLPPFDSPVGSEEQVADLFAKASSSSIKQLASKLGKRLVELDTFKKKVQTPKTLQRISFLERDLDRLNAEMWNVSNHDKTRRTSPRELFNVFRLARARPQPIQFAQTPTLEYKGDHHSDSDAANETQLATTDHEKIEMIKKVKVP
ncbi:hypothetical protein BFJ63_vAg7446 [Fusarium oxysporum f. sp. narcissi]|uniref:Endonuclease/exonuclease/phosphatase domain-containing protein n=1 Tax=Fusarium oxysporum f. sp. narcissi TaxID=451672 RepID=A0A4V1S0U1_FUSOX|nr:hypothetical protein BFJ63_vAg7446 [Fusarium oxysporum f. sp. narcissi]